MIVQEQVEIGVKTFLHTYSDAAVKIEQVETGRIYDDAMDVIPCQYTYVETDQPIEDEQPEDDPQS